MRTYLSLPYEHPTEVPEPFGDDIRTPPSLVEHALERHTEPGDVVLDPFAGFGTTLVVAERLGRVPYGIEYEADRAAYVRGRIDHGDHVVHGSTLDLEADDLPAVDCCFTSPPFMTATMERNPFENYAGESSYDRYLDDVREAFDRVGRCMVPGSCVLLDVSNIKHDGTVTTLAWDVGGAVADVLDFRGEVVVTWEADDDPARDGDGIYGYGYDHSYCLVYEA